MFTTNEYYKYLISRSWLALIYRRFWLYPKINKRLTGLTLDVGCGIGDMLAFRRGAVGTDINPNTIEYCSRRGFSVKLTESGILPFADNQFDSVLLDNVLEHVNNPIYLLAEISRVLKIGGSLVIGVPGILGWESDPDHKIAYDEKILLACVTRSGFRHQEFFYTPLWRSVWLSKRVRQYCIYAKFINSKCY